MQDISNETRVQLEKRYRTTGIIYLAQISSAILLVIIGYVLVGKSGKTFDPTLTMALWAAILFIAVGTFLLRRKLYRWERLKDLTLLKGVGGLLAALQTNSIILGAMAEAIILIGFVIAILTGARIDILRAGLVALIVLLINFPRQSVWKTIVGNLEKL